MSSDLTLMWIYFACVAVLVIVVWRADDRYYVLRDSPASGVSKHARLPYSLARVQMAFWTIIVVGSIAYLYVKYIWGPAGSSAPTLDPSVVTLMGISGATGLVGIGVDVSKDKQSEAVEVAFANTAQSIRSIDVQLLRNLTQKDAAGRAVPPGPQISTLLSDKAAKMGDLAQQQITLSRVQRDDTSEGPITDIMTDQNGNSLHRLQLILFTLVYGSYFVIHVAKTGNVDVSYTDQMLELMGISGGLYAGFKIPGKSP